MIVHFGEYGDIKALFQSIDPLHSKVCTLITGDPGSGKSALACACALENMSFAQRAKYKDACAKIDYLNTTKNANFQYPPEKHLVFVTGFKVTKFAPRMTSYDFDAWRVGMNDPKYKTQYFPKHSLRVFDEIQQFFTSQQDKAGGKMPLRVSTEFQKNRHYDIYNIGTAQVGTDVNKKLRDISSFVVVKNIKFKYSKYGNIVQTMWNCLYLRNHHLYDSYIDSKGDESYAKNITFVFKSNIFRYYNCTACEQEFDEVYCKYCSYDQTYEEPNSLMPPDNYSGNSKQKE